MKIDDILEDLSEQSENNVCIVIDNNKCNKLNKDYQISKDLTTIKFSSIEFNKWEYESLSAYEMLEAIGLYQDTLKNILIENYQGEYKTIQRIYESALYSPRGKYSTIIVLKDIGDTDSTESTYQPNISRYSMYEENINKQKELNREFTIRTLHRYK